MKLVIISDTHGSHEHVDVPYGDVVIHCGDCTENRGIDCAIDFLQWYERLPHKHKIFIAGNHDKQFEKSHIANRIIGEHAQSVTYLCESGVTINGIKFWGSPYTPEFFDWHFMYKCGAEAQAHWNKIPDNTDVLITHGPPHGFLDLSNNYNQATMERFKDHLGCRDLKDAMYRVRPELHCFGHIHGSGGKVEAYIDDDGHRTTLVNASIMDESYAPVHEPIVYNLYETITNQTGQ